MEETALPLPSSTLAPPPLETAATGTRALQRFDLGKMRPQPQAAPATARADDPPDARAVIARTVKMAVPARIKALTRSTVKMAVPARIKALPRFDAVEVDRKSSGPAREAQLVAAAWALGASASLALACSAAGAAIYVLVFP